MLQNSNKHNSWLGRMQKQSQQPKKLSANPSSDYFDTQIVQRIQQLQNSNERVYLDTIRRLQGNKENQIQIEIHNIRNQIEEVKQDLKEFEIQNNYSSYSPSKKPSLYFINQQNFSKEISVHQSHQKSPSSHKSSQIKQKHHENDSNRSQKTQESIRQDASSLYLNEQHFRYDDYLNRQLNYPKVLPNQVVEKNEIPCQIYLFCYFARINKSSFVQLLSKNKICLKEQDKVIFSIRDLLYQSGKMAYSKTLQFKNQILTSAKNLTTTFSDNDKFFMYLGMKSSGKQQLLRITLEQILSYFQATKQLNEEITIRLEYSINPGIWNCNFIQKLPFPQKNKMQQYSLELNLQSNNLTMLLNNFWFQQDTDAYNETKKLLRMRLQVSQCKNEKKDLLQLIQNHIFCVKILKVRILSTNRGDQNYWIMTSNYLPKTKNNWVSEVFLQDQYHQGFFEGSNESESSMEGQNVLKQLKEEERKIIFCINPLRYKMNECIKTFEIIPNFEQQMNNNKK